MNKKGKTQFFYFFMKGMTASVEQMWKMRNIDVEEKREGVEGVMTCLMNAAFMGQLVVFCRLLLDKRAQVNVQNYGHLRLFASVCS